MITQKELSGSRQELEEEFVGTWRLCQDGNITYTLEFLANGSGLKYTKGDGSVTLTDNGNGWMQGEARLEDGSLRDYLRVRKGSGVMVSQLSNDGQEWDEPDAAQLGAVKAGEIACLQSKLAAWNWLEAHPEILPSWAYNPEGVVIKAQLIFGPRMAAHPDVTIA